MDIGAVQTEHQKNFQEFTSLLKETQKLDLGEASSKMMQQIDKLTPHHCKDDITFVIIEFVIFLNYKNNIVLKYI